MSVKLGISLQLYELHIQKEPPRFTQQVFHKNG